METAVVKRFLDFFQDFVNLCQQENWPSNVITATEIKNAFLIAIHIEKCLDEMQKRDLIDEFLSTFNDKQDASNIFLKSCFSDPPRFILKKIIQSESKIEIVDISFKLFVELFSEEKLELYLTDFFVEAASKETLLNNLSSEISKERILYFKSELFLSELTDSQVCLKELLSDFNESTIELLIISLSNKDFKYRSAVEKISKMMISMMLKKSCDCKKFWRDIFDVEEKYLINTCLENDSLFVYMCRALIDCGRLIQENMSTEYFYIDFNYSELCRIVGTLFKHDKLKAEFFNVVKEVEGDLQFWMNLV